MRSCVLLALALLLAACGDEATPKTGFVVLDVEAWVGKRIDDTDLAWFLDVAALPDDGIWFLWRDCCEPCAELITQAVDGGEQPLVLVQIPDRGLCENRQRLEELLPKGEHVIRVTLPDDLEWVVTVPAVLVLRGRRVIFAAQGVLVKDYIHVPAWAKVAPEQIAEAKKHGVPVAFENDLGMKFVLIPAGTFLMGSPEDEEGRHDDETQHEVTISKPFYMSVYEVTNEQFEQWTPTRRRWLSLHEGRVPLVRTGHGDATEFAAWLSQCDASRSYALPTEAEWEYSSRAGTTTRYFWGESEQNAHEQGAAGDSYVAAGPDPEDGTVRSQDGRIPTLRGTRTPPNAWGLYDMHHAVPEWCGDWYGDYASDSCTDPEGPEAGDARVVRGDARPVRVSPWPEQQEPIDPRSLSRFLPPPLLGRSAERTSRSEGSHHLVGFRLVSPLPVPGEGAR